MSQIDRAAGFDGVWRPITMTPINAWGSIISLLVPLGVFLWGIQTDRQDLYRLLPVLMAFGAVSGLIGIVQIIGPPEGPFYFYRITNNGSAVGLFANRNHAAVLLACMFPLFATYSSAPNGTAQQQRLRQMLSLAGAMVTVPLILVTGSRSGLFVGLVGILFSAVIFTKPKQGRVVRTGKAKRRISITHLVGAVAVLFLGLVTVLLSKGDAITRIFAQSPGEDTRGTFWRLSLDIAQKYFPIGSGLGSFVEAYQINEPLSQLNPLYVNHAHNDWIELYLTLGLPGLGILAFALVAIGMRGLATWRAGITGRMHTRMGKLAAALIAMLAMASVTDYPLRTPSLMAFLMVCLLWLFADRSPDEASANWSNSAAEAE
ncbi:O-antigen ligase family protein [Tsuneonella flava]|uniref:O-antigen ligase family protein n=1 Tax=Tsuneonella flava TaxID=2055955 RepID=A0ABX7KCG0_9SPHN|nr:O-antigen ligase family protein [Tsuneonella flava]QSB45037.1 O-antigen ligase family protein [Tsuneonella flava]